MTLIPTFATLNHQFYYDVLANPDGTRVVSLEDLGNAGLIDLKPQENLRTESDQGAHQAPLHRRFDSSLCCRGATVQTVQTVQQFLWVWTAWIQPLGHVRCLSQHGTWWRWWKLCLLQTLKLRTCWRNCHALLGKCQELILSNQIGPVCCLSLEFLWTNCLQDLRRSVRLRNANFP